MKTKIINISSTQLKIALLYYYRFKRGYSCCDEVYTNFHEKADILVDTKKHHYEIEIKTSKSDLRAEKNKKKHKEYTEEYKLKQKTLGANKFYICVPTELISYAEKWIQEINPKYGLIEFRTDFYFKMINRYTKFPWDECLWIKKKASMLHKNYNINLTRKMIKRLSSALINAYISLQAKRD